MSLRSTFKALRADLRPDTLRGQLVRATAGTAGLKVAATAIAFLASLIYARTMGPNGYGTYAYVMAWVAVLTIPASLGLPAYLVREASKRDAPVRALLRWADTRILLTGLASAAMLVGLSLLTSEAASRWPFLAAAAIPLIANLSSVRQSLLQAKGAIVQSQWPQLVFAPCCTLALLLMLWLWRNELRPLDIILATSVAALFQLAVNATQLGSPPAVSRPPGLRISDALPFMWIGALHLIVSRVDLILLGGIKGATDAGIYAVASRAAELVLFFLTAANIASSPKISSLHHAKDHAKLQQLATSVARRLLWITLPLAAVIILGATPMLRVFYGGAYTTGARAMQILAIAQLFTVLSGPVGALLNMTEHAAASAKAFAAAAMLNIVLNLVLIPTYGITGAATSTAISVVFCNTVRWYWVRRYLKINPSAFGI